MIKADTNNFEGDVVYIKKAYIKKAASTNYKITYNILILHFVSN